MVDNFIKFDGGKIDPTHLPIPGLRQASYAMENGNEKYGRDNWKRASDQDILRFNASLMRHTLDHLEGLEKDEDSGLHPLAHVASVALILSSLYHYKNDKKQPVNPWKKEAVMEFSDNEGVANSDDPTDISDEIIDKTHQDQQAHLLNNLQTYLKTITTTIESIQNLNKR